MTKWSAWIRWRSICLLALAFAVTEASLVPIRPHSDFRPIQRKYGLLEHGSHAQIVEFPEDLPEAVLTQNHRRFHGHRRVTHIKSTILTVAMFGLLAKALFFSGVDEPNPFAPFLFAYVIYLFESFFCSTRRYLSNMHTAEEVLQSIQKIQLERAAVRWDVECFHYQNRWHSASRSRGGLGHEDRHRVVTHRARRYYEFERYSRFLVA
jgi:hypothetical protein